MIDPLGTLPLPPYDPSTMPMSTGSVASFTPTNPNGSSFADLLQRSIREVDQIQDKAANQVEKLVTGETGNVHEVMIATEEASTALELLLQIRNKIMAAWDELKRVSV